MDKFETYVMRPFRLLFLDDGPWEAAYGLAKKVRGNDYCLPRDDHPNVFIKFVREIVDSAKDAGMEYGVECCVIGSVDENERRVWIDSPSTLSFRSWPDFLRKFDVVFVDFKGIKGSVGLERGDLPEGPELTDSEFRQLAASGSNSVQGAAFFLKFHNLGAFSQCRAVFLVSSTESSTESMPHLAKTVNELATVGGDAPWVVKLTPGRKSLRRIAELCRVFFEEHKRGFTALPHSDAIEFTAHHDRPVVIIGETGTGKEWTAKRIHLRWSAERIMDEDRKEAANNFRAMNCAAVSAELARSELFGHVSGAFTGATSHSLGMVLAACGCRPPKRPRRPKLNPDARKAFEALGTAHK